MGRPLEYWIGTGGWVTSEVMKNILTRLRAAVRLTRGNARILLWMDAASQHVGIDVLNHAARLQIVLVLPAGLTWLMQPLDVYVFAKLKTALRVASGGMGYSDKQGGALYLGGQGLEHGLRQDRHGA